jgi:hypothetical protein
MMKTETFVEILEGAPQMNQLKPETLSHSLHWVSTGRGHKWARMVDKIFWNTGRSVRPDHNNDVEPPTNSLEKCKCGHSFVLWTRRQFAKLRKFVGGTRHRRAVGRQRPHSAVCRYARDWEVARIQHLIPHTSLIYSINVLKMRSRHFIFLRIKLITRHNLGNFQFPSYTSWQLQDGQKHLNLIRDSERFQYYHVAYGTSHLVRHYGMLHVLHGKLRSRRFN